MSSDFFKQVYEVVKLIPRGKVTSYGSIAKYLSMPRASRMVGYAMNNCHQLDEPIPAHRVVNRNGLLTGKAHFGPNQEMENLLKKEGITIKDDQILNFKNVFWDPMEHLSL